MSKHEDIIKYILSLEVGTKISVRSIASDLGVSDGTAYRAIKDSDSIGIVTTIPRVGTVRIEKVEKKSMESLTYGEVINIVDGSLLGGKNGIHKVLHRFIIGCMNIETMKQYIKKDCLVIIGNREEAQRFALLNDAGVLITDGFGCSNNIKNLANEKCLPIIATRYDTFTASSMINKAISENLLKKEIVLVEDIMKTNPSYLNAKDTVFKWKQIMKEFKHIRYPVVDDENKLVGIVSPKDLPSHGSDDEVIGKVMCKEPITVTPKTTAAYAADIMRWDGIELFPVVKGKKLMGVITRKDVINALQYMARQPQLTETLEDSILKKFELKVKGSKNCFTGRITAELIDYMGTGSWGALNMLLSTMAIVILRRKNNANILVDNINTYFMKPVQIDNEITIYVEVIDKGINYCKVEVNMFNDNKDIVGKSILSAKMIRR